MMRNNIYLIEINKNLDFVNNLHHGDKMELKNLKDLESLAKNDKYLKDVYVDFEKFINEKYTEKFKIDIESIQDKNKLHEIIVLFALTAWVNATINEIKKNENFN